MLLLANAVQAQRPIPQIRPGQVNPNQRQVREAQPPQEGEELDGRRTLLDDSTRMVYGPNTALYFYEKDLKRNSLVLYPQDTLLDNFHNYDPVAKSGWKYQDLGNIGSAATPVFYQIPELIGTRSGFDAYDLYHRNPENNRYFDTKSPFTNMSAFFGGGNRNMLDIEFARNVNPRWNVGFEFHTIRARKTLNPVARDDNMATNTAYSLHTNYRSENGKYWFLGSFSRTRHLVNEIGGIIPPEQDSTSVYFTYEDAKVWLRYSQARDLRQDYHFYHEYKVRDGFQVYHVFDRKNQTLIFETDLTKSDSLFFPQERLAKDSTLNFNDFAEWRNEFGFKGSFGGFYYNAFTRLRNGRMRSRSLEEKDIFNEVYLGGELIGKISEKWSLRADGEYLLPGAFRLHGLFVSPWLELEYTKALYKPTSMQQQYGGNFYQWSNDFSNIGVDQVKGTIKVDFEKFKLRPSLTINRVNNYVYFGADRKVAQNSGEAFMLMPGLQTKFNIGKKFKWEAEVIYTHISGDGKNAFRIPELFGNTMFYFDSPAFDENVFVQLGVDVRYKSSYFANAYFPAYQQFYLQDRFDVYAYPVVDLFLDFRINRTRVLLKYNHLNAGFMNQEGYFVTPDYTGYKSFIDLGITWYLFD
ncbi:putative porin [Algoriphagus sp. CAU 1675]|uniref:putative porin n=1 Tax=Algoriphagus sp. CAU 1675 TaxID=3032597 RepID=UPI0023DA1A49|nr:putative porin [Algoriphagus sp. CAU 1675]MDF2158345.1 putative porin [Algoriphagus sp. CAU 1675]